MRFAAGLLILLLACGARSASHPAWPKQSEKETDGGESLAPHEATTVAATEDDDEEDEDEAKPAEKPAEKPATPEVKPTVTPPTPPPDEPIITEDIVIEIEE